VDPVVERRKRGQRHRLDPDDLLEDEVGAVEPECALVGPEGAERPLAAEGMQFVPAGLDVEAVESHVSGHPRAAVTQQRVFGRVGGGASVGVDPLVDATVRGP
jgi:hypothetical protein